VLLSDGVSIATNAALDSYPLPVHLRSHLRLYDIFGESGNRKVREKLERVSAPANKALDDLQAYDVEESKCDIDMLYWCRAYPEKDSLSSI
jgi:hypothetical protein